MALYEPNCPRRQLVGHLIWFLSWLGTTAFGAILKPDPAGHGTHTQLGLPPCPSVLMFDRPCPGCGMTTSFSAVIHGKLGLAFEAHPMGPLLYLLWTVTAWACLYGYWRGWRFVTDTKWFNYGLGTITVAFIAFGAWRFCTHPLHANAFDEMMRAHRLR